MFHRVLNKTFLACNFTKSYAPRCVVFTFFELYKCYQIVQHTKLKAINVFYKIYPLKIFGLILIWKFTVQTPGRKLKDFSQYCLFSKFEVKIKNLWRFFMFFLQMIQQEGIQLEPLNILCLCKWNFSGFSPSVWPKYEYLHRRLPDSL